jgi:hypothetical protein
MESGESAGFYRHVCQGSGRTPRIEDSNTEHNGIVAFLIGILSSSVFLNKEMERQYRVAWYQNIRATQSE